MRMLQRLGQPVVNRIGQAQRPQILDPPTEHQRKSSRLTNIILVHARAALLHNLGCTHENILKIFMHIECRSVIDAIPLSDSPAILILGTPRPEEAQEHVYEQ
jgi:hypothetical protein